MAPRAHRAVCVLCFFLLGSALAANPSDVLNEAAAQLKAGNAAAALATLKDLRFQFPDTPESLDAQLLCVRIALAQNDAFRARYWASQLADAVPTSAQCGQAAIAVADLCYNAGSPLAALEYYRIASGAAAGPAARNHALLRSAELELYNAGQEEDANHSFDGVERAALAPEDRQTYAELWKRLRLRILSAGKLGLTDPNVSFLRPDADQLWIGTWNGGVARYAPAAGKSTVFSSPATFSRTALVSAKQVWVGTAEGLWSYSKASQRWASMAELGVPASLNVQALAQVGGTLYAGTLESGLMLQRGTSWARVTGALYGPDKVSCLSADPAGKNLLVGTVAQGVLIFDPKAGAFRPLSALHPEFTARNVTALLVGRDGVWVATYGDGLFLWTADDSRPLLHFTHAAGQLSDDWVLSLCETANALYAGTLSGGVSVGLDGHSRWQKIGIDEGMPSLGVASIAFLAPFVYFGTLGGGVVRYQESGDGPQL